MSFHSIVGKKRNLVRASLVKKKNYIPLGIVEVISRRYLSTLLLKEFFKDILDDYLESY